MLYQQLWIGLGIILALGSLVTAIWYGTRVEKWQIVTVEVSGGQTISHKLVQQRVVDLLEGKYYRLIPRRFSYLYPEDAIVRDLYSIPRLRSVELTRADLHTLHITFTEYQPYALWCHEQTGNCMLIDDSGFAFTVAPTLSGSALVRYYTPQIEFRENHNPFSADQFESTKEMIHTLKKEMGLAVVKVLVRDRYDISYYLSNGAEIKTSSRLAVADSISNLKTVLANESFDSLKTGSFNYIDLRFGDKVFVSEEEVQMMGKGTSTEEVVE